MFGGAQGACGGGGYGYGYGNPYANGWLAQGPSPYGGYVGGAPFMMAQAPYTPPYTPPATPFAQFTSTNGVQCVKPPAPYPPVPGTKGPDKRRRGVQYLYPDAHTFIHVVDAETCPEPWNNPGQRFQYEIFSVDTSIGVPTLIKRLGGDAKAVVTEFTEVGDGFWSKGQTVTQEGARALEPLSFFGKSG